MNAKNILGRIHWILWFVLTILTGILAGFLTSHSVMLGRYFTWLIETGNYHVFTDTFAVFRAATHANVHYNLFLWASFLVGILWTILCFILKKGRITALVAGLSSLWVSIVFFASNFSDAEVAVSSGTATESVRQFFVSWNLPMHRSFAIFYILCFLLLLLYGTKQHPSGKDLKVEQD